ncbi:SAM-dependent methyltransferase [Rugosimonospora acidiphila]
MNNAALGLAGKPATAARMYDYFLGGVHNFPADRDAARRVIEQYPLFPQWAVANRAFLRRAVRYLLRHGIRQFLDLGSGIPTVGNVHEIAHEFASDARVVYVDIDSVAVAESLEILDGNKLATAIRADLRDPRAILDHPDVRAILDFERPVGLLLAAVLHFVPEDEQAYGGVEQLVAALAPGSYLTVSHVATESLPISSTRTKNAVEVYTRQTATSGKPRDREQVERFFTGLELVEPGVAWLHDWRPDPNDTTKVPANPTDGGEWAAVGRKG